MKVFIFAALLACAYTNPVEVDDTETVGIEINADDWATDLIAHVDCINVHGLDACEALKSMPEFAKAYWLTDDQIKDLVLAKLRALRWVVGKIAGPNAEAWVTKFIEEHHDTVVNALTKGGIKLVAMLKDLVKGFIKDKFGK